MNNMKLKICGLQSGKVLKSIANSKLPVDYLGFVMAPSKRQVSAHRVKTWLSLIPEQTRTVGVFVDPDMACLNKVMQIVPFDVIQLHGDETPEFCKQVQNRFNVEVWKAWRLSSRHLDAFPDSAYATSIDVLLLDTFSETAAGGTGRTFDWNVIPRYQDWCLRHGMELFAAGGIHAGNVTGIIDYQVDGIDVSSGVETDGVKDIKKIEQLVKRVKGYVKSGTRL
ncbi:MAG: phosphoribosylanthranilate isomerase [Bacillaceae bacterium]|nr:phosphoribosylanthranilate isomerase [Bacillaceae bacterium]